MDGEVGADRAVDADELEFAAHPDLSRPPAPLTHLVDNGGRVHPESPRRFSDLVRLETELWDLVEARLRRDHDLALSWFESMQVIDAKPGCRVIDIAEALSITIGGTSKLVDRIEHAGWCERSPNPDDGRSSTIELTCAGRQLLAAAQRTFADEVGLRLGTAVSVSELQRFAVTVRKLRSRIHEQRESP